MMAERLAHVLALAYHTGQKELVLGAFGCGVFGNNIERVAAQWQTLLSTTFKHCFHRIIFATINDHEYTALARVVRGE